MGKIIVTENVALDGVVEDPEGKDGSGRGGWFQVTDQDREAWAKMLLDEALAVETVLIGRRSDAWFAERWLSRTGAWADRLNSMPKYVVSSTLTEPKWSNSTVLKGDVVTEVTKLKRELTGDIVVYASARLVHTLMEHDLVDELRLFVFPAVVGAGKRIFGRTSDKKPVRLLESRAVGDSCFYLAYQVVRD